MRRTLCTLLSAAAVAIGFSGASNAAGWEDLLAKLYPEAKKEGELVFNTERIEEIGGKEGVAQFEKRFPGIKVVFNGLAGSQLPSRIAAEAKAGRVSIDAFRSDPAFVDPLVSRDLLLKIDPAELTDQQIKVFLDGHFIKLSDHISNFIVNTALVKPQDRPKRYEDLLDPKWERRIVLDARGGQIAHLLSEKYWDEKKFWSFVKGLKDNKPLWTSRNTEAMAKITSGEGYVGTGSYAAVEELKRKGAPVDFLFLGPALSQVRGVSIIKAAAHPNAAKLFIGWLLSPEGLEARDVYAVGTITPGTTLYDKVKAAGAQISYEETMDQVRARDEVGDKITKEWGVLK
jgi:iron(III) transport system substrate-binding protein